MTRKLSPNELESLIAQGNIILPDTDIEVAENGFDPSFVRGCQLSGRIRIGANQGIFDLPGGMKKHAGLFCAKLHNVEIGDDCLVSEVHNYIANYRIGNNAFIENVGKIVTEYDSTFGNGVRVSVLNETGGREVTIYDRLSSHQAYMSALYRHRPDFVRKLDRIALDYAESVRSSTGEIGDEATIVNTVTIANVRIGSHCRISGASRLCNGTINSCEPASVRIGHNVVAEDFIICSGSQIEDGTMLTRCFVGQACIFGHSYSATDSLFFSNCQGENGEACAVFAGPYTVTHHKSTLLIAGNFSFMNAGSGSNQSNHMYKLGPIHQGTLERGAKTASDSYILWPSRVGAFSLVMGRHVTHSDTTNLPFSYLIEKGNNTYLAPGVNLRSVGTIRDAQKWPKRDGRKDSRKLDQINFDLLTPFTVQKMIKGLEILKSLLEASGELSDIYSFHSTKITNSALHKGIDFYTMAIDKFMGECMVARLHKGDFSSEEDMRQLLKPDSPIGSGEWVDLSGLIVPKSEVEALMNDVEEERITSVDQIEEAFKAMNDNFSSYEWTWAFQHYQKIYGVNPSRMTPEDAVKIVNRWKDAVLRLDKMIYEDARKEFNLSSMTGFGADGDRDQKEQDFEQVRGDFESNSFVGVVLKHIEEKSALAEHMLEVLEKL
ncbi:MAG: DUF4954 family protein [Bacteroidales bacterium]|nr:DUF4954 family protein [Bacteroidales bacterium]